MRSKPKIRVAAGAKLYKRDERQASTNMSVLPGTIFCSASMFRYVLLSRGITRALLFRDGGPDSETRMSGF